MSVDDRQLLLPAATDHANPAVGLATAAALGFPLYFLLVYYGVGAATATRSGIPALRFEWESRIPFVPWTILPYLALHGFCIAGFFVCRSGREVLRLLLRLMIVTTLAGVGFLAFPMQPGLEREAPTGIFAGLYHVLWMLDTPRNQFPSLHAAVSVVLWSTFARHARPPWSQVLHAAFGLMVLSTVLTRQHHLPDLLAGLALGGLGLVAVRTPANS